MRLCVRHDACSKHLSTRQTRPLSHWPPLTQVRGFLTLPHLISVIYCRRIMLWNIESFCHQLDDLLAYCGAGMDKKGHISPTNEPRNLQFVLWEFLTTVIKMLLYQRIVCPMHSYRSSIIYLFILASLKQHNRYRTEDLLTSHRCSMTFG